eukprot:CAMPEP_0201683992 /NCGR_PEP_ID=MMETSP0494-20130426/52409_1 /ASSEMBLY_ACC=CAM_ASM_000839 /TAXON_ID=420259 /ORGANISM="Thalassiosira gravida, Strain GMp14c1" /LENGTH=295 /DNA_ID=CAMNT_0048167779 /DNA_START=163 /DNA_END=1050 /DNA_ORIENTATION=-
MAEKLPSSSSSLSSEETPTDGNGEGTGTRLSKRKRLSSLGKRLRLRLSSFLERSPSSSAQVEIIEHSPIANNETLLRIEKKKEQIIAPSSEEDEEPIITPPTLKEEEQIIAPSLSPKGEIIINNARQSKAAPHINLSGTWKPIVTETFKKQYDSYLDNCGENFMFRKVVVNGIVYQKETIRQLNDGVNLEIIATNPAGNWNRTLVTSEEENPRNATIVDPDGDEVQVEAWWEESGCRHKSILRCKPRVEGGVFETVRYLEGDGDVLVCESCFTPASSSSSKKFKYGQVMWKFRRC